MHKPKIITPGLDPSTVIWRYMDLAKFLSLLMDRTLWFSRMDHLTDEHEGELPFDNFAKLYDDFENDPIPYGDAMTKAIQEAERVREHKKFTLVNSWTINDNESFALWNTYLGNGKYGVAIKSSVQSLIDSIGLHPCNIEICKVEYKDILDEINLTEIYYTKKHWYSYENELRLIIKNQFIDIPDSPPIKSKMPKYETGTSIEVDIFNLIDRVVLPPKCEKWFFDTIDSLLDQFDERERKLALSHSVIRDLL